MTQCWTSIARMKYVVFALLFSLGHLLLTSGNGVVKFQFIQYENNNGLGANGVCCDGKWGFCQRNGCDHMFTFCLDATGRPNDISRCQYGKFQSKAIKNQDITIFGSTIANLSNPLPFNIDGALPPEFDFKVDVFDHDNGLGFGHDHVDTLTQRIKTQPQQNCITKSRTRLVFMVFMACSQNYYGPTCGTHCPVPSPTSHYTCDLTTGQKVCLPGYGGEGCKEETSKRDLWLRDFPDKYYN